MKQEYGLYIDGDFIGVGSLTQVKSKTNKILSKFPNSQRASVHISIDNLSGVNNTGLKRIK